MLNITVTSDPRYIINKPAMVQAVSDVLNSHKVKGKIEVELMVVGDRKMHELNKAYRGIDATTDILTFVLEDSTTANLQHTPRMGFVASPDRVLRLGSIVISYTQAMQDAAEDNKSIDEELVFLAEHGTKHLLGIHHD